MYEDCQYTGLGKYSTKCKVMFVYSGISKAHVWSNRNKMVALQCVHPAIATLDQLLEQWYGAAHQPCCLETLPASTRDNM